MIAMDIVRVNGVEYRLVPIVVGQRCVTRLDCEECTYRCHPDLVDQITHHATTMCPYMVTDEDAGGKGVPIKPGAKVHE